MVVIRSPLRYPGGKAKLFPFVSSLIEKNGLHSCTYAEPYAGGAGLALNLLFSGFCKSIALNDLDPAIYSFWWSILNANEEFLSRLHDITFSIDEWLRQKERWSRPDGGSKVDLGFATYYLNRTNRSGIIEGAGPIGGYKQDGAYKMDARFSLGEQVAVIKAIGSASNVIEISNLDASQFIQRRGEHDSDFLYLDPPYYVKGQRLYRNSYEHEDHESIAALMRAHKGFWMVSYDNAPAIRGMYSWSRAIDIKLQYSAGPVMLGEEVVFLSDRLRAAGIEEAAA